MAEPVAARTAEKGLRLTSAKEAENLNLGQNLMMDYLVSMGLRTILELGVPDILAKASEPMTPEQIVSHLKCKSPTSAAVHLKPFLALLARKGLFSKFSDGKFGLTDLGEMFATTHHVSLAPFANLVCHDAMIDSAKFLQGGILTDNIPFVAAHGISVFNTLPQHPRWIPTLNVGLASLTSIQAGRIAAAYPGFKDIKSMVDVGGGVGTAVGIFVAAHPHLRGINLDQPQMIASAPPRPGVEHVSGDFFVSIPSADLMFIKSVLHNHDDERCVAILKNCYEALPKNGKLVISETFLTAEDSAKNEAILKMDVLMVSSLLNAHERTLEEYVALLRRAGFSTPTFVKQLEASDLLEVTKL